MGDGVLNIGIVGAGFGCAVHLPAFEALGAGVRVTAVADRRSGRADAANQARARKLAIFDDGCDLAVSDAVDVVSVAIPPREQLSVVRAALEHGKAVLCEKPFGLDVEEAARVVDVADSLAAATAIGFEFRYDPGIGAMVDAVADGVVGSVRHVAVDWLTGGAMQAGRVRTWRDDPAYGGGILNEFCSHVFDYSPLIAGGSIMRVWCRRATVVRERTASDGLGAVGLFDACDVLCDFSSGATGRFSVSNAVHAPLGHRVEVFGEAGALTFYHAPPFLRGSVRLELRDRDGTVRTLMPRECPGGLQGDVRQGAFRALAADFIAAVRGDCPARLPRFRDGLAVRRVIAACETSVRTGCFADVAVA